MIKLSNDNKLNESHDHYELSISQSEFFISFREFPTFSPMIVNYENCLFKKSQFCYNFIDRYGTEVI